MDLEQIERALEKCRDLDRKALADSATFDDLGRANGAASATITMFSTDLLRLVRAMRWMEAHAFDLEHYSHSAISGSAAWAVVDWQQEMEDRHVGKGPDPLAAIEAAMTAQETKESR